VTPDDARRWRCLLDALPGPASYLDPDYRFSFTNRKYVEWFGSSLEPYSGRYVWEVLGSPTFETIKPYIDRALGGERVEFEETLAYRTGGTRLVHVRYVPDEAGDGAVRGVAVIVSDLTDQRRAEQAQEEADRRLTVLVEASGKLLASPETPNVLRNLLDLAKQVISADAYSVWRRDAQDHTLWRMAEMSGLSGRYSATTIDPYGSAQQLPREPLVIEDIERAPFPTDRRQAYLAEGICSLVTVRLTVHGEVTGTLVFYYRKSHPISAVDVRIAAALGNLASAAITNTELYARQNELRRIAESDRIKAQFIAKAGEILSSSLDLGATLASLVHVAVPTIGDWAAIDTLDEAGLLRRVATKHIDPAKMELALEYHRRFPPKQNDIGYTVVRTGESMLIPELTSDLLEERVQEPERLRILLDLGLRSLMLVPLTAKGRNFGLLTLVMAESGRSYDQSDLAFAEDLARRAATAMDHARLFSESAHAQEALRRSNAELRRANEDLNQFAYSASHDLKEPLRILAVYSQLLEQRYTELLDEQGRQYLSFIIDAAKRMETLLRDLLEFMEAMSIEPAALAPVNTEAVLRSAMQNLAPDIEATGARIAFDSLPDLRMQETHLLQVFQNLLGNAIKYRSDAQPSIAISAEDNSAEWTISVKDNGIGIPEAYRTHVFGLFKRLHGRSSYPGTGIGLAICQRILERYGGKIWVQGEPNEGSEFLFTIPK
jgi:PAS domain S-box-containing protein